MLMDIDQNPNLGTTPLDPLDDLFNKLQGKCQPDDLQWTELIDWLKVKFTTLKSLSLISPKRLQEIGCTKSELHVTAVCSFAKTLLPPDNGRETIINDPIHGSIHIHPLVIAFIDTKQFQRLRHIKQMASLEYVYPGAVGTRFEHSLGVYHLAGQLMSRLRHNQPDLHISDVDILCVQLAGLCHDLGHGPYSHLFDGLFMPKIANAEGKDLEWRHEDASVDMFNYLIEEEKVKQAIREWGINREDIALIRMCIRGRKDLNVPGGFKDDTGRDGAKVFLLDIVANGSNGLDVDKWDYLKRDSYHMGIPVKVYHERMLSFIRVNANEPGSTGTVLCLRDKQASLLLDMLDARYKLHNVAYQHKVASGIESMFAKVLILANDHLKFKGNDGRDYKMSECKNNMEAYRKLTDRVFDVIMYEDNDALTPAKKLLERIDTRDLWKPVGSHELSVELERNLATSEGPNQYQIALELEIRRRISEPSQALSSDDIDVRISNLHYGTQDDNPLNLTRFYTKMEPTKARSYNEVNPSGLMQPASYRKKEIVAFCTSTCPRKQKAAIKAFQDWTKI